MRNGYDMAVTALIEAKKDMSHAKQYLRGQTQVLQRGVMLPSPITQAQMYEQINPAMSKAPPQAESIIYSSYPQRVRPPTR